MNDLISKYHECVRVLDDILNPQSIEILEVFSDGKNHKRGAVLKAIGVEPSEPSYCAAFKKLADASCLYPLDRGDGFLPYHSCEVPMEKRIYFLTDLGSAFLKFVEEVDEFPSMGCPACDDEIARIADRTTNMPRAKFKNTDPPGTSRR
jgi:hypothetical protein